MRFSQQLRIHAASLSLIGGGLVLTACDVPSGKAVYATENGARDGALTPGENTEPAVPAATDLSVFFSSVFRDGHLASQVKIEQKDTAVPVEGLTVEMDGTPLAYDGETKSYTVSQPSDGAFDALTLTYLINGADHSITASQELRSIQLESVSPGEVSVGGTFDLVATGPEWGPNDHLSFALADATTGQIVPADLTTIGRAGDTFTVKVPVDLPPGSYKLSIGRDAFGGGEDQGADLNTHASYSGANSLPVRIVFP
jgi:hypothetical protein